MAKVTVLGMGLLGSGFAESLLDKGHEVTVWNRTASRCAPLAARGARVAETAAAAVRGAARVHLVLSEDAAVDAVIEAARPGLGDGVPVVDHSTNLPARVAARFAALRREGVRYVHAPVFMSPANARAAGGLMLLAGPAADEEALRPALQELTGRLWYVGAVPEGAAVRKLMGNGLMIMMSAAMGDLFALGAAHGLSPEDAQALFERFAPAPAALARRAMDPPADPPSFRLSMARKDVRLMLEAAGGGAGLRVLPHVAAALDEALARGLGDADVGAFAGPRG